MEDIESSRRKLTGSDITANAIWVVGLLTSLCDVVAKLSSHS